MEQFTDPNEQRIAGELVKKWDAGVTQKFQDYSSKLKGYEDLGDVNQLSGAMAILKDMQTDPVGFYDYYQNYLVENKDVLKERFQVENVYERLGIPVPEEIDPGLPPEFEGLPSEVVEKIQGLESQVSELSQGFNNQQVAQQNQEQAAMLDKTLADMHTKHEVPETQQNDYDAFVLSQFVAGRTPEQANEAWDNLVGNIGSQKSPPAPDLMRGSGSTPLDQVDKAKLRDPSTRKELGAQLLRAANQQQ